jgi:hypothetical protein
LQGNLARLGEPIPVLYGETVTTPDFAAEPYTEFVNNEQFAYAIFCLGQGRYADIEVLLSDTPVSSLSSSVVQVWSFTPEQHGQAMGTIEATTGIMENVVTSVEVGNQEFVGQKANGGDVAWATMVFVQKGGNTLFLADPFPNALPAGSQVFVPSVLGSGANPIPRVEGGVPFANGAWFNITSYDPQSGEMTLQGRTFQYADEQFLNLAIRTNVDAGKAAGPFRVSKDGQLTDRIMLDLVFPQGIYSVENDGDFIDSSVSLRIFMTPVGGGAAVVKGETITGRTQTPQRLTFSYDVPPAVYEVRLERVTPAPTNNRTANSFVWLALKGRVVRTPTPVYGDVTLVVLKVRATNGVSDGATNRVRVRSTRKLPVLGAGPLLPSRCPADAFVDALTNTVYGGRTPIDRIDIAELARLKAHWEGEAQFDGGFSTRGSVFDAASIILQPALTTPVPLGSFISVSADGVKPFRSQLFSDANIIEASVQFVLPREGAYDSIDLSYRDAATFNPVQVRYPAAGLDPDEVELVGVTDPVRGRQHATLVWQRQLYQRRVITLRVEQEGLLIKLGDRFAASLSSHQWGQAARVLAQDPSDPSLLTLSEPVSIEPTIASLRDADGRPSAENHAVLYVDSADPRRVKLASLPEFTVVPSDEQPDGAIIVLGQTTRFVRDFIATNIRPAVGGTVEIEGINYDPRVYVGTLPFAERPL